LLENPRAKLVISHSVGDEGDGYAQRVHRYADMLAVPVVFAGPWIGERRGAAPDGRKLFTLQDVFPQANLVTYPSTYEGFGNAFLEAVYFKRPVVCNRYSIYRTDIEPSGFKTISFDGYLTDNVVEYARRVLHDQRYRDAMTSHNYEIGQRFFSYDVVHDELRSLLRRAEAVCRCASG